MAELPEIAKLAGQMNNTLHGKTVKAVTLLQEKCANISADEFIKRTVGTKINNTRNKGKWIITSLDNGENILLSLGMGADILYFENEKNEPEKFQVKILFTDGTGYTARFWWFGKFLLASDDELSLESNTKDIAIDPYDEKFTLEYFTSLLKGKKTQIKAFLMNQKNVGGIGNMYMHDILFKARIHPQKKISDMSADEIKLLYKSITDMLNLSREKGAFAFESDFFGQKGGFNMDYFLVGYKENQPCPVCGETIVSVKTGSTSTFICPVCQKCRGDKNMSEKTMLQKVSEETMRFMRGNYVLDEVSNGKDNLAFRDGDQIILIIYIRDGYYDFQVEQNTVKVFDMEGLDKAKRMILSRKEPNRKPFPKEQALFSDCGHRCDLCVHYRGGTISKEFRLELKERIKRVYEPGMSVESTYWGEDMRLCDGCTNGGFDGELNPCEQKKCAAGNGASKCTACKDYPCGKATAGFHPSIQPRSILADDVTWAILPYVDGQYGN